MHSSRARGTPSATVQCIGLPLLLPIPRCRYWDNNVGEFVRVWDQAGVIPGRVAIGPKGTVYVTAGAWNYK